MVNMWREHSFSAGDDLTFRLEYLPIASRDGTMEFVLNHWKKGVVRQRFDWMDVNHAWQLVPAVHCMHPPIDMHEGYDYREHGFWHVARSQVMKMAEAGKRCHQDDSCFLRGSLVEATFEPVFMRLTMLQVFVTVSCLMFYSFDFATGCGAQDLVCATGSCKTNCEAYSKASRLDGSTSEKTEGWRPIVCRSSINAIKSSCVWVPIERNLLMNVWT